jgi:glyoxylase-like metal-dependent hydrolase (beta-lactamase superfamily II)
MREYVESLDLLLDRDDSLYWPTHGAAIEDPHTYVTALKAHREERAQQVLSCLRDGLTKVVEMVPRMYAGDVPQAMYPAAARSVFSTLIWLIERGEAAVDGEPAVRAGYSLA